LSLFEKVLRRIENVELGLVSSSVVTELHKTLVEIEMEKRGKR